MAIEWFLAAAIILLLDQTSKALVVRLHQGKTPFQGAFRPRIRVTYNACLGLVQFLDKRVLIVLWSISLLATILLTNHVTCLKGFTAQIGLGVSIGGATGNLIDILRRGLVIDFIDLRIWPVFNIADAALVIGLAITFLSLGTMQIGA